MTDDDILAEKIRAAQAEAWMRAVDHLEPALGQHLKRKAHADNPYVEPDQLDGPVEYNFWDDRTYDGTEYTQEDSERDLADQRMAMEAGLGPVGAVEQEDGTTMVVVDYRQVLAYLRKNR